MNSIDFHNSCVANEEYYAKRQAELEYIYAKEASKYSKLFDTSNSNNKNSNYDVYERLISIENRLDIVERKIEKVRDELVNLDISNGLFIFAPEANIKSNISFQLSEQQFNELLKRINK